MLIRTLKHAVVGHACGFVFACMRIKCIANKIVWGGMNKSALFVQIFELCADCNFFDLFGFHWMKMNVTIYAD